MAFPDWRSAFRKAWPTVGELLGCSATGYLLRTALAVMALAISISATSLASTPEPHQCPQFVVGRADSSAYPRMQLPARGTATGVRCPNLKRVARGLYSGRYRIPASSSAQAPRWGDWFSVRNVRLWSCQLQNRGLSGPTYAVRCASGRDRLWWSAG
jgi:hypothetical protein